MHYLQGLIPLAAPTQLYDFNSQGLCTYFSVYFSSLSAKRKDKRISFAELEKPRSHRSSLQDRIMTKEVRRTVTGITSLDHSD